MNELAYDNLDAPVGRLHTDPISHSVAPALERAMLVDAGKIVAGARCVLEGRAPAQNPWRNSAASAVPAAAAPPPSPQPTRTQPPAGGSSRTPAQPQIAGEPTTMPFGDLTVSEARSCAG